MFGEVSYTQSFSEIYSLNYLHFNLHLCVLQVRCQGRKSGQRDNFLVLAILFHPIIKRSKILNYLLSTDTANKFKENLTFLKSRPGRAELIIDRH